ncbi:MAG: leucyl/phenylalanyl-tRNA--protein transferase [Planctomycetes bacterium]|nr:leucyl/phenylalanyl-tRNA--protein transferase [Planctomycetota bacterium]
MGSRPDEGFANRCVRKVSALSRPRYFPPPHSAGSDGFLGVGGLLNPQWLLDAYRHGIFPWPLGDGTLAWFSPDPRAIFEFTGFHVSRRLRDTLRSGKFRVTFDQCFADVIDGCATAGDRRSGTWITRDMRAAYIKMHRLGYAHSVEAWLGDELAGGVYGMAVGGYFAAESMFYRVSDASKVALATLVEHLKCRGFGLLDIQQMTPNSRRLGAVEIPRRDFLRRVAAAVELPASFRD